MEANGNGDAPKEQAAKLLREAAATLVRVADRIEKNHTLDDRLSQRCYAAGECAATVGTFLDRERSMNGHAPTGTPK